MGQKDTLASVFASGVTPPASAFAACGVAPASSFAECGGVGAPVIEAIFGPTVGAPQVVSAVIRGRNFVAGAVVAITGVAVTAANVVVVDATTITCDITATGAALTGPRTLTVTTANGVSNAFGFEVTPTGPLSPILSLGTCELLLDAIDGMTGAGGFLTSVTDLSPNARAVTIVGAPTYTPTKWGGVKPAAQFTNGAGTRLTVPMPNLAQPFSYFAVIDSYLDAAGLDNLINAGPAGGSAAVAYATGGFWTVFAGNVYTSSIAHPSAGKIIRFDLINGVASETLRGGTSGGVGNAGAGSMGVNAILGIGARNDGVDSASVILAACGVFSELLTANDMAALLAYYTARYPGVSPT